MGIYRRGKSWVIDFYYRGKRYTESCRDVSLTLAREREIAMKAEIFAGTYKPPRIEAVRFKKFSKTYLEHSTNVRDESSLKHLLRFFKDKKLSEISMISVERYKKKRQEEGAAPGTINRELACLKAMFSKAIKWGKTRSNPVKHIKLLQEPKEKDRILSPAEEQKLLETIRKSKKAAHLGPIVVTAINTGARKGEILGLRWSDADLKNGILYIRATKTNEIWRVPLNETMQRLLRELRERAPEKAVYIFSNDGTTPYTDIKTAWWKALEDAGIEGLRFHDLRHTFGSRLGMAGVDTKTIQELMGHHDIRMTMRYSHPTTEHKRLAVEKLKKSDVNFDVTREKKSAV